VYYVVVLIIIAAADLDEEPFAWRNFLFIMNLFPLKEQFMTWTWSLSVEMQFYVTFPLFLWILFKIPQRFRLPFLICFVLSSFVVRAACLATSGLELPHTGLDRGNLNFGLWWSRIYTPPWTKYGSLYSGVTLAYIFNNTNWLAKAHQVQCHSPACQSLNMSNRKNGPCCCASLYS
jgi:peptidoglycan/LPS O-acetylase OafA/YrhL